VFGDDRAQSLVVARDECRLVSVYFAARHVA